MIADTCILQGDQINVDPNISSYKSLNHSDSCPSPPYNNRSTPHRTAADLPDSSGYYNGPAAAAVQRPQPPDRAGDGDDIYEEPTECLSLAARAARGRQPERADAAPVAAADGRRRTVIIVDQEYDIPQPRAMRVRYDGAAVATAAATATTIARPTADGGGTAGESNKENERPSGANGDSGAETSGDGSKVVSRQLGRIGRI